MKIILNGRIPSKKNNKRLVRNGARTFLISSPEYLDWEKEQSYKIRKISKPLDYVDHIVIKIWFPDNRGSDLTNKAESIMDLLVLNGIIKDDKWQNVPWLELISMHVDKENPRAEIEII